MATIKSFTDIYQSKNLAQILPLESADMHYNNASIKGVCYVDEYRAELMDYNTAQKVLSLSKHLVNPMFEIIPCWSLASLLSVLPNNEHITTTLSRGGWKIDPVEYIDKWFCEYENEVDREDFTMSADNPVDACYEFILKLNELNLL